MTCRLYTHARRNMRTRIGLLSFCILSFLSLPLFAQPTVSHDGAQIRGALDFLASDILQGRGSGTHDELLAAVYLASQLQQIGIEPIGDSGSYIQNVSGEFTFYGGVRRQWNTRNVIGVLRGRDEKLKDEVILLTAHMDHLGVRDSVTGADKIFNGAD